MRRFKLLAPAAALAVLAFAAASSTVSAEGSGGGGRRTPGVLEASGDGIAAAAGKLSIHVCAEEGLLLAKGDVSIEDGAYTDSVEWLGLSVYFGFSGCADVGPSEGGLAALYGGGGFVAALAVGSIGEFNAEGNGFAFLKGEGTWGKDNGDSGEWTEEGQILKIGGRSRQECPAQNSGRSGPHHCKTPEPEPEP